MGTRKRKSDTVVPDNDTPTVPEGNIEMPFDPNALATAEIVDITPTRRGSTLSDEMLAPYVEALYESAETQKARALTIPAAQVAEATTIIRAASKITFPNGVGARLRYTFPDGTRTGVWKDDNVAPDTMVKLEFWGGKARKVITKPKS